MLKEEMIKILEKHYEIKIKEFERSKESTDKNVYIIQSEKEKYVLKIYNTKEHTFEMINLHMFLKESNINVPEVIKSNTGENFVLVDRKYFVMYSFIEGKKLKYLQFNKYTIEQIAEYLRNLHELKNIEINLERVPFQINSNRMSILHFDVTKNNIFYNDGKIYFIDFDDAKYGPAICDVAIAVTNLFISKANGADINGIKCFIDSYYGIDDKIKKEELPLIKEIATTWLKSILNNSNFDMQLKAGIENKLYWIDKIYETMMQNILNNH